MVRCLALSLFAPCRACVVSCCAVAPHNPETGKPLAPVSNVLSASVAINPVVHTVRRCVMGGVAAAVFSSRFDSNSVPCRLSPTVDYCLRWHAAHTAWHPWSRSSSCGRSSSTSHHGKSSRLYADGSRCVAYGGAFCHTATVSLSLTRPLHLRAVLCVFFFLVLFSHVALWCDLSRCSIARVHPVTRLIPTTKQRPPTMKQRPLTEKQRILTMKQRPPNLQRRLLTVEPRQALLHLRMAVAMR